jgi:hypothetical protein
MDLESPGPGYSTLIIWLKKLGEDLDTMLQWLEGQAEPASPPPQDAARVALERMLFNLLQRQQRERLHAFGLLTNALVLLRGNPTQGGLLLVNTHSVQLSPTEWPFVLILAEAMQQYRTLASPQRGFGFVTKDILAARAQELTRGIRTTFRPESAGSRLFYDRKPGGGGALSREP